MSRVRRPRRRLGLIALQRHSSKWKHSNGAMLKDDCSVWLHNISEKAKLGPSTSVCHDCPWTSAAAPVTVTLPVDCPYGRAASPVKQLLTSLD